MKLPLIHAPCEGVHPYFEKSRFWDENSPNNFHFFILALTRYIARSKNRDDLPTTNRLRMYKSGFYVCCIRPFCNYAISSRIS